MVLASKNETLNSFLCTSWPFFILKLMGEMLNYTDHHL